MFTRSDGTRAIRLSVMNSVRPVKMLLNPRSTAERPRIPMRATSTPGWCSTCSIGDVTWRSSRSRVETTSTAAGASSAFSYVREVVTVSGLSSNDCCAMVVDTSVDWPAATACVSSTTVTQPGAVNRTEYEPAATPSMA